MLLDNKTDPRMQSAEDWFWAQRGQQGPQQRRMDELCGERIVNALYSHLRLFNAMVLQSSPSGGENSLRQKDKRQVPSRAAPSDLVRIWWTHTHTETHPDSRTWRTRSVGHGLEKKTRRRVGLRARAGEREERSEREKERERVKREREPDKETERKNEERRKA